MKDKYKYIVGVLAVIIVVALVIHFTKKDDHDVQVGYNKLVQTESVSVAAIEAQIEAIHQEEVAEQLKQQMKEKPSKKEISSYKKLFENSVVMGDSIIEGLLDFNYLYNSSVVCHRGWSVAEAKPMVSQVVKLQPANIFMSFGVNDIPYFNGDAKRYRKEFKKRIEELKKGLPNVKIYINSILPVQDSVIKERLVYKRINQFNQQLQEMCQEIGAVYIDNGPIVKSLSGVYETDGIHMHTKYYPHWLKNMAEKAGLI